MLEGLGGKPDDPVRSGCSGLFRSLIGCWTWIKFPGFGTFRISGNGVPVPQDSTTSNDGDPEDPGDSSDQDNTEIISHAHEKTKIKSEHHAKSTASQSNFKTAESIRPSSSRSGTQTEAVTKSFTVSTRSPSYHSSTRPTASRSTASHSTAASASATSTKYIIVLEPAISTTQLEGVINGVKAHAPNMYNVSVGSRPNDTVICAKLNSSSFNQFSNDPLVSSRTLLRSSPSWRKGFQFEETY